MATKKILADLELDGSITSSTFNIGNSGNYIIDSSGDVELYGDASVVIESGDGVVIEISDELYIDGSVESSGSIKGTSFIKTGGTSSQFLKADGSVDSNTYAIGTIPTNTSFVDLTTAQSIAGIKTFQDDVEMYEGKKLILDIDGDGFCSIKFDNIGGNVIYESSGSHHFKNGEVDTYEALVAGSFIKSGGTSSQFLKADGSVDTTTYTGDQDLSGYLLNTSDTLTGTLSIANSNFTGLSLTRNSSNGSSIDFNNSTGLLGRTGFLSSGSFVITNGGAGTSNMLAITSAGNISATNLSGTNTGDQDLSGYLLNTTDTLTGRLTITSSVRVGDDTATATSANEGALRYYTDVDGSYVDMCMQYQNSGTPANDYKWVNIVRNIFPS